MNPVWRWLLGEVPGAAGSLQWTTPTPWVVAAAVVAAVAWGIAARGARPGLARAAELLLWAVALSTLVAMIAGPVWVEEEGRVEPGRVAVLVDASASMGVKESSGPRSAAAGAALAAIGSEAVDVYHFGTELRPGPPGSFDLPGTDVESALHALSDRVAGERLAGIVLLSDGVDRGALRRGWQRGDNPVPPAVPGPLTVVQIGAPGALQDLSVQEVDAGGYAYVHAPFSLRAQLRGTGFEGKEVKAELLKDGAVISTRRVVLDAEGKGEVSFEVTPDRAGRFAYLVSVPAYDGDAVPANNVLPVVVRVVRDKMRVLQVAGAPSWDVKFLRRFLKGDPSIDLVSFFILRTKDDRMTFRNDELSLIQFPHLELFTDELLTFDLVVFQNFDYKPYFEGADQALLQNLANFVTVEGHGLVMLGGDRSFGAGDYQGTPLGDVLPVELAVPDHTPDEAPFRAALSPAGERHPITRLVSDPAENKLWWERLHTADGTNRVGDLRPGAAALLEHPTLKTGSGAAMPVLAVREVGAGRTMSLTVDTSWRWSLSEAAEGRGNQAFLRFWKNSLRWLVGDPTAERVVVETGRENYAVGEEVRIVVRAKDAGFAPQEGVAVRAVVRSEGAAVELEGRTDPAGEAVLLYVPERRGAHRVEVKAEVGGAEVHETATVFAVTSRDPELDEVVPDGAFLEWLATRSGGTYIAPGEAVRVERDAEAGRTVWTRRELPLWRTPAAAIVVLLSAGIAWIVRRRFGLR